MRFHSVFSEFPAVRGLFQSLFYVLCLLLPLPLLAQSPAPSASSPEAIVRQQKIDHQLAEIPRRQKAGATIHELSIRWALIGAEYGNAGNIVQAESGYNHALQLVAHEQQETELYSDILDQLGALYRIYGRTNDALRCYRQALAIRAPFLDPLEDARSRARLAEIALESHEYKEAYSETDQAYHSMLHMSDPDSSEVLSALLVRVYAQCGLHHMQEALQDATEALRLSRKEFPEGSMQIAASLTALGFAQLKDNDPTAAEFSLHNALDLFHAQLSASDPRMLFAMQQYRQSLVSLHRKEEARQVQQELEAIARQPQTNCANCTVSAFSLRSPAAVMTDAKASGPGTSVAGTSAAAKCPLSYPRDAEAAPKRAAPGPPEP